MYVKTKEAVNTRSIKFSSLAIYGYTLCMTTSFIFSAYIDSFIYIAAFLLLCSACAVIDFIGNEYTLKKSDVFWITPIIILMIHALLLTLTNKIANNNIGTLLSVGLSFLFFISTRIDLNEIKKSISIIKIFSIMIAISVILQFLFFDIYLKYLYPHFVESVRLVSIYDLTYAGITSQIAIAAGYITNGIGIIICFWFAKIKKANKTDKKSILIFLLLIISLILTKKRAHFLFMASSLVWTYWCLSKKSIKKIRLIITIIFAIIVFFAGYNIWREANPNTMNAITRLMDIFTGLQTGEDISSGRFTLYGHTWNLFLTQPLFGIGWLESSKVLPELIGFYGSSILPHNVYLQLLCETGIFGFIFFMIPMFYTYIRTYKKIRNLDNLTSDNIKAILYFSFYSQTFFLLYCMTGNPLYDLQFLSMYILACVYSYVNYNKISFKKVINLKYLDKIRG